MKIYLVDNENMNLQNLAIKSEDCMFLLFMGKNQTKVPINLAEAMQNLGQNARYVRLKEAGKNGLDFIICYHLGQLKEKHPDAEFFIVSKDKDFDALLAILNNPKIKRVEKITK